MKRLVLIGCSKTKRPGLGPAKFIYRGTLFSKSLRVAQRMGDEVLILSTKYGLVRPEESIQSYDETFSRSAGKRSSRDPQSWAEEVAARLRVRGREYRIALVGEEYLRHLRPLVEIDEEPMAGLSIGRRLQWLSARDR